MIKNFKLFEKHEDIHDICRKYNIKNYTINNDGSIDVDGNVILSRRRLIKLPLKFGRVSGNFRCSFNKLTSLEGCPDYVGGYFYCSNNKLTSLEGCPDYIGGDFNFRNNKIYNLDHFPKTIKGHIYSYGNPVYHIINNWINDLNRRDEYLDYFFDCDPIHDKTVVLIRLKEFLESYNLTVDMDEVKKYYNVITYINEKYTPEEYISELSKKLSELNYTPVQINKILSNIDVYYYTDNDIPTSSIIDDLHHDLDDRKFLSYNKIQNNNKTIKYL